MQQRTPSNGDSVKPQMWLGTAMRAVETALLVTLLAAMVGVATYQIVARNLFGTGLVWGSDLVHVGMLWATMIGAVAAARGDRHISIDLVARFGGPRLQRFAARVTALFAAVLCGMLAWHSIAVVKVDFQDGTPGVAVVPAWVCESIIPLAGAIMSVSYLLRALWPAVDAPSGTPADGAPSPARVDSPSAPPPAPAAGESVDEAGADRAEDPHSSPEREP